ncbi:MAG: hypothetical protein M1834_002558 [Cirrosporium novae-zelandiae]|nr:MAG: hypothetical protein M1834_002558 [Cirrosporium novae-zelandiae]
MACWGPALKVIPSKMTTFILTTCCLITFVLADSYRHDSSFNPDYILRLTAANYAQSCANRYSVLINGTSPGPELRLAPGQTTWIRIYNDMDVDNATVHWHGLTAMVAPFSDGTPAASQWPIAPGHFFDYELHPDNSSSGTYFYHSHVGFQAVSASGALIVEDLNSPPYSYDDERILHLGDFFSKTDEEVESGLLSPNFMWSGESENVLVNGLGRTANATANSSSCALAAINVDPGKTYRLRFIGGTALSFVALGIESHSFTVIEVDGAYTKPYDVELLQIATGQRFSVLLKTKTLSELQNSTTQQYYMQLETRDRPTVTTSFAILNYLPNTPSIYVYPNPAPLSLPDTIYGFLDHELSSLDPQTDADFPTLAEVTRRITIYVQQFQNSNGTLIWEDDGVPWMETFPSVPYLVELYEYKYDTEAAYDRAMSNGGLDGATRTFPAKLGEVLEIVFINGAASSGGYDTHPFHFHGGHPYDLGSGNGTYDPVANEAYLLNATPIKRDTSVLYHYVEAATPGTVMGWRAFRVRVQDAGVWMVHCHILQHMIMGMQTVWVMGTREQILGQSDPADQGYLTYGGDAYGNDTYDPLVRHHWN